MRATPTAWPAVVDLLVDRLTTGPAGLLPHPVRVAVDGADAARPGDLADALVAPLRERGRPVLRVPAAGFLRAASLRLERGRTDPDAYFSDWLDADALGREVLDPAGPGGSRRVLPSLRDPVTDRATRAAYVDLDPATVVVVDGPLLLGRELPFDLVVHLAMGPGALARRTDDAGRWTLPALARYDEEVDPLAVADVAVRVDDPRRPALVARAR